MKHHGTWMLVLCAICALAGPLSGAASAQGPDPRLKKVFTDWEQRYNAVKSVEYVLTGERVYAKGAFPRFEKGKIIRGGSEIPPHDVRCTLKRLLLIDFATGRHRLELNDQEYNDSSNKLTPHVLTQVFDGQSFKGIQPPKKGNQPNAGILTGDLRTAAFEAVHWPLFAGHGIVSPLGRLIVPGKLKAELDTELFFVHGEGVHAGQSCLVIRTQPRKGGRTLYDEFWVDVSRQSAVLRHLQVSNGQPFYDFSIQYQKTSHGWLPGSWTYTAREPAWKKTRFVERIQVERLTVDPELAPSTFDIQISPNTLLNKAELRPTPKQPMAPQMNSRLYRIGESGEWNEVVVYGGVERRRWPEVAWWLLALLAFLVLGGWLWWRRKARLKISAGAGGGA